MNAIETVNLTKSYGGIPAVDSLNLVVPEGELFALLGMNGAGKTTTIRMLCGLSAPTGGRAMILGRDVATEPGAVRQLVGLSPQETAVALNLTARENLVLMARLYGLSDPAGRAHRMADQLGLLPVINQRARKLSGGWQRRLSIAMALVTEPRVLFLDEPTLGLDVLARRELWGIIKGLHGKVTIVLTTHYLEEAEALSDRIGLMAGGKMVANGTAEQLTKRAGANNFEDAFVALLVGG